MSKFDGLVKGRKKAESVKLHDAETVKRLPGRPKAKRSDPAFKQVTAIIRKDTHEAVQRLLIGQKQDFSEVLQQLLAAWVQKQT